MPRGTPTPFTVIVHPHLVDEANRDELGNPAKSWGADRSEPVIGFAPAGTSEPLEANRTSVEWDLDLLVPPLFECGPHDEITALGDRYTVEGGLQDFTKGPWWQDSGKVLRLSRVEG